MSSFLLDRRQWSAKDLINSVTPRFSSPNKKFMFDLAVKANTPPRGTIGYSRWSQRRVPEKFETSGLQTNVVGQAGFFDYATEGDATTTHWHLNFANCDIFAGWATPLLAQDELQVVEHPSLIALRLAAKKEGTSTYCVEEGYPTPILITGVERRLLFNIAQDSESGRPYGLYGSRFAKATPDQLNSATTVFENPALSNILAIEAPPGGSGFYSTAEIGVVLVTAFSGFAAVRDESRISMPSDNVTIHTGYWGCGAYGGNRVLMALLQMLAAEFAGVPNLVFHVGDPSGHGPFEQAVEIFNNIRARKNLQCNQMVEEICDMKFPWGVSDGN